MFYKLENGVLKLLEQLCNQYRTENSKCYLNMEHKEGARRNEAQENSLMFYIYVAIGQHCDEIHIAKTRIMDEITREKRLELLSELRLDYRMPLGEKEHIEEGTLEIVKFFGFTYDLIPDEENVYRFQAVINLKTFDGMKGDELNG